MSLAGSLGMSTKECWQVDRGEDLSVVWSCEGLGDPTYFYVNGVWLCAAGTAFLLFVYGSYLSESILGGFLTILCFFFNHSECTRVQWTPPLRESFGYPLILAQLLSVSWCLRQTVRLNWRHLCSVAITTSASLVTWQFSQFVFLTQGAALVVLWFQNRPARPAITVIFLGKLVGLQNAVLLVFANDMLLSSLYGCSLVVALGSILFLPSFSASQRPGEGANLKSMTFHGILMGVGTILLRWVITYVIGSGDDVKRNGTSFLSDQRSPNPLIIFRFQSHIFNLLRSKVTSYRDFHTMMYTCAAEFDFLSTGTIYRLSSTLLLPSVYAVLLCIAFYAAGFGRAEDATIPAITPKAKKSRNRKDQQGSGPVTSSNPQDHQDRRSCVDPAVLYNVLQLAAFILMAAMIMRLKLFMSPHLCIMAGLLASSKVGPLINSILTILLMSCLVQYMFFIKSRFLHWAFLVALVSGMSVSGWRNLTDQRSLMGEYSNPAMEELISWIQTETPKEAAFAGPMPVMASVLLTTGRPVVNHPHYESAHLRERTKTVYRSFGRGTVSDFYRALVDLKVSYLVLQDHWCFGQPRYVKDLYQKF